MKKALFIATYGGFFSSCELQNMNILKNMGYKIYGAANFEVTEYNERPQLLKKFGLIQCNIPFVRSPFSFKHYKMYKKLVYLIDKEKFDVIDTHNPIVSVLARLAAKKCKVRKVIYTAHGFFFYKGCPIKNLLIYKPIEYILAKYTDGLIVINKEDYSEAKKMNIRGAAYYVPGIGLDCKKVQTQSLKLNLRKELNLPNDSFLVVSVGELNRNKNHISVIKAISKILSENPEIKIHYCICGQGKLKTYLNKLAIALNVKNNVHFLGFRKDIIQIDKNANLFVLPSYREGLSVSLMEAMACGLPIIASNIRGNVDLIDENKGGVLVEPGNIESMASHIIEFYNNSVICCEFGLYNIEKVKEFGIDNVKNQMQNIYKEILG